MKIKPLKHNVEDEDIVEYFLNHDIEATYKKFPTRSHNYIEKVCQRWINEIDAGLDVKRKFCNPR